MARGNTFIGLQGRTRATGYGSRGGRSSGSDREAWSFPQGQASSALALSLALGHPDPTESCEVIQK